jgi:hypothetical protein
VTKARLHEALWPGVHVSEASLHGLISELRTALGDSPRQPRFLRTVHRHGYAFYGDVVDDAGEGEDTGDGEQAGPTDIIPVGERMRFTLVWGEHELPLHEGDNVIGRDLNLAVSIPATTVSRRHARITIRGGEAAITDLDSKNGTVVAGEPLRGSAPRALHHGDAIRLGSVLVTFRVVGTSEATATSMSLL